MNNFRENNDNEKNEKISRKKSKNKKNKKITKCDNSDSNNDNNVNIHKDKLYIAFKESIKKNKWYYLTLLSCFYMFKQSSPDNTSYLSLTVSYILILLLGHIGHRISHNVNFTKTYNKFKKNNMNPRINGLLSGFCRFLDFHSITHHDTTINKQPANILYELINNVITQGGALVLLVKLINNFLDLRVMMLWALMYATTHNINYVLLKPSVHRDHHVDNSTNFGIDIADILFDTKYNLDDIETHNHVSINLIIITLVIIYYCKFVTCEWNKIIYYVFLALCLAFTTVPVPPIAKLCGL